MSLPPHLELGERGEFALRWLADNAPLPNESLGHSYRSERGYAHALGSAMVKAGVAFDGVGRRHGASQGAANTLAALKRRGFARNSTPGGEAFQSVRWGITADGLLRLEAIDRARR